jgi:hypothetical protein
MPAVKSLRREIGCCSEPLGAAEFCGDSPGMGFNPYECRAIADPQRLFPSILEPDGESSSATAIDLEIFI